MQLDPADAKAAKPGVCGDDGTAKHAEPANKPDAVGEPTT
jgi:hypothetical protein